jgi:hypothetical protein
VQVWGCMMDWRAVASAKKVGACVRCTSTC